MKTSRFPSNLRFEPNLVISLRAPAQTLNFQLDDHHHHDGDVKLAKSYHSTMCCVELYYSWLSFQVSEFYSDPETKVLNP